MFSSVCSWRGQVPIAVDFQIYRLFPLLCTSSRPRLNNRFTNGEGGLTGTVIQLQQQEVRYGFLYSGSPSQRHSSFLREVFTKLFLHHTVLPMSAKIMSCPLSTALSLLYQRESGIQRFSGAIWSQCLRATKVACTPAGHRVQLVADLLTEVRLQWRQDQPTPAGEVRSVSSKNAGHRNHLSWNSWFI